MKRLQQRAEQIARGAVRRHVARLAEGMRDSVAGAKVEAGDGRVVLTGRRLMRQWLHDASLRFVTGLVR